MKNKLIILFFLLLNISSFSQIVRTLPLVNNTADTSKPVSSAQKIAITQKLHTVSTISALQAFTDATICQYDGSVWNKISGNVASNGGSYAGTIVNVSTSFYWQRKFDNIVNIKWFGAVGDGVTENYTAFNLAKTYLSSIAGGTFFIPKGIFLISQQITFDFSNLQIKGEGIGISVIKVNAWIDGIRVANGYPASTSVLTNITISDLTIDGNKSGYTNGANDTNGNGVNINSCDNVTITNVEVKNPGEQGIVSTFWEDSPNYILTKHNSTVIDNCIVWGCKLNRIGIGLEGQIRNARVTNNSLHDGGFIQCSSGNLSTYDDEGRIIISDNIVDEGILTQGIGIWVSDWQQNVIVTDNIVKGFDICIRASTTGLGSVKNNLISNNNVANFRQYGILGYPTLNSENDNLSVFNNVIYTVNTGAVGIGAYKNAIITNNNITGTYQYGLQVNNNCYVANNKIDITGSIISCIGISNKINFNFISSSISVIASNDVFFNFITGFNGYIDAETNKIKFSETGVRTYNVGAIGGNLAINSGDGLGALTYNGTSFLPLNGGNITGIVNISGNTGIGTVSPLSKLHLIDASAPDFLRIHTTISGGGDWTINPFIPGVSNGGLSFNNKTTSTTPFAISSSNYIGIGTTAPVGIFDVTSTTIPSYPFPRMTTTQINSITGMVTGAFVFDTTALHPKYYNGTAWVQL